MTDPLIEVYGIPDFVIIKGSGQWIMQTGSPWGFFVGKDR
jgi:hypothetical protein|tara:strand:+ start:2236 stop:2355 length:120 start_codon:yes stop_codon:yes gene_type:complete